MSRTPSNMLPLGTPLPAFNLLNTMTGDDYSSELISGAKASVIMFICNHCPYVKHVNKELVRLANDYLPKNIRFVAISSNDIVNYPEDSPGLMKEVANELKYPFPYLFDETQEIAKAFDAACTPEFYIFDENQKLVYRGQLDDSKPSLEIPVTGKDVRNALDSILAGKPVDEFQRPSIGCNIKWKDQVMG